MHHIHITGIPDDPEYRIWKCDYVVWPIHKLLPDDRFRKLIEAQVYVDYVAVLTVEEALEVNARFMDLGMAHWRQKMRTSIASCWGIATPIRWCM